MRSIVFAVLLGLAGSAFSANKECDAQEEIPYCASHKCTEEQTTKDFEKWEARKKFRNFKCHGSIESPNPKSHYTSKSKPAKESLSEAAITRIANGYRDGVCIGYETRGQMISRHHLSIIERLNGAIYATGECFAANGGFRIFKITGTQDAQIIESAFCPRCDFIPENNTNLDRFVFK